MVLPKEGGKISSDVLLREKRLTSVGRIPTDATALPAGASLLAEADWAACVKAAGGETKLLTELGIVTDDRTPADIVR